MTTTRTVVLAEFALRAADGTALPAQMVQPQTWHASLSNPRWIDGDTFVQVNGSPLEAAGPGQWLDASTGERFTTA